MKNLFPSTVFICFFLCFQTWAWAQTSCLSFDGTDDYVVAPNTALNNIGSNDFTFEAWIKGDEAAQHQHPVIFSNRSSQGNGVVFFFHGLWGSSNYKMLCVQLNGVNYSLIDNGTLNGSLLDGTCHHVAVTRQNSILSFFADGALIGTREIFNGNPTVASSADLWIGQDGPINQTFEGEISQVRIWNVVRTEAEIFSDQNTTISGTTPGLSAYWELNDGSGQVAVDKTTNFDGQLGNSGTTDGNDPYWLDDCCEILSPPVDSSVYCCDLPNIIENGNFEQGNTGFTSDYSFTTAGPTPLQYNVTNSGGAAALCSNWLVEDPSTCINGANGSFLTVNGLTSQASNTGNVIWEQTLTTEVDSMYRFCAKFKDLPACCLNGQPAVQISFSSGGGLGWTTINTDPTNACDWQELTFNFTASSTSETIRILLDHRSLNDGNDLAIDDIGLFKKEKPSIGISLKHDGRENKVTASIHDLSSTDDALPSSECQPYWIVGEVTSITPLNVTSTMIGYPGMGWGLTTTFPGYNGGGTDGAFNDQTLYLVYLVVSDCDCYSDAYTYQMTYDFMLKSDGKNEIMPYELQPEELEQLKADVEQYIENEILIESGGKAEGNPNIPNVISLANNERSTQNDWNIYPNPTTDRVQVFFQKYEEQGLLTLFDVNGIAIKTIKKETNAPSLDITMNDLPAGVYLLQFDYQGKIISKRIVKH